MILEWLANQNSWVEPIVYVLVAFACLKYLILDWD